MRWIDILILIAIVVALYIYAIEPMRKRRHIYKGRDKDFADHCALSIDHSPLLQLSQAPDESRPYFLVFDTETVEYVAPQTIKEGGQYPPAIALSWRLLDRQGRLVKSADHLLLRDEKISVEAYDYHHISQDEMLGQGKNPTDVYQQFMADLANCTYAIAHHYSFHQRVVASDLVRLNIDATEFIQHDAICLMRLGINYLTDHEVIPPVEQLSLNKLFSQLFFQRNEVEIKSKNKAIRDVTLSSLSLAYLTKKLSL